MAYTMVDVDSPVAQSVIDAIAAINGVLSVRSIPAEQEAAETARSEVPARFQREVVAQSECCTQSLTLRLPVVTPHLSNSSDAHDLPYRDVVCALHIGLRMRGAT